MNFNYLKIRQAKIEDAKPISLLSQQLGYSVSEETIQIYLKSLETAKEWIVYVACKSESTWRLHMVRRPDRASPSILGWINIYIAHGILADKQAEIGGLIVDRDFRGRGIGRLLVQKGQTWAQQQGCNLIQVRSQTKRQQAHVFYQNIGYEPYKTQLVLRKQLNINQ